MMHWTIKHRIMIGFALVLGLVVSQSAITFFLTREIRGEVDGISTGTLPGTLLVGTIRKNVSDIQILMLRVLLARTAEERAAFETEIGARSTANAQTLAAFEKTLKDPAERERLAAMTALRETYKANRNRILALADAGKPQEALDLNATIGRPAYQTYDSALSELVDYNTNGIQSATTKLDHNAARVSSVTLLAGSSVLILGAVAACLIVSGLTRILARLSVAVGEGSAQVAMAASQVSGSSQSLAEGASEQAASLEETSASLEELSSMTKRNADSALSAKALSGETRSAAETGNTDMNEMRAAMDAIKTSSSDIAKIIKAIDEIAFQTNILALNAAVEAARAGEAGAGFAVVADEVRALAQRSANSAKETAAKIEVAIRNGDQGVIISSKVAQSLTVIVEKARQVDNLIAEIANASQEQNQGISQINTAVSQMDQVTQSSAASAEETAAAAQELNAQSFTLNETVGELQRLVGGKEARPAAASSASAGKTFNHSAWFTPAAGSRRPNPLPAGPGSHEDFFQDA